MSDAYRENLRAIIRTRRRLYESAQRHVFDANTEESECLRELHSAENALSEYDRTKALAELEGKGKI